MIVEFVNPAFEGITAAVMPAIIMIANRPRFFSDGVCSPAVIDFHHLRYYPVRCPEKKISEILRMRVSK
jgi:hypothetical protein